MQIQTKPLQALWIAESLPVIGVIPLAVTIFLKCVVFPCLSDQTIQYYHCLNYLRAKTVVACCVHALPILGPLILRIWRDTFACMAIKNYPASFKLFMPEDNKQTNILLKKLTKSLGIEIVGKEFLKNNPKHIEYNLLRDPKVFRYIDPSYLEDKNFLEKLILLRYSNSEGKNKNIAWVKLLVDTLMELKSSLLNKPTLIGSLLSLSQENSSSKSAAKEITAKEIYSHECLRPALGIALKEDAKLVNRLLLLTKGEFFNYIHPDLKKNREIAIYIGQLFPQFFEFMDEGLMDDKELFKEALGIGRNNIIFKRAHPSLKKDRNYVENLMVLNPCLFEYIDPSLQKDELFFKELLESPFCCNIMKAKSIFMEDENFVEETIVTYPKYLKYVPRPFKNEVFFRKIIEKQPGILKEDFKEFFTTNRDLQNFLDECIKTKPLWIQEYGWNLRKMLKEEYLHDFLGDLPPIDPNDPKSLYREVIKINPKFFLYGINPFTEEQIYDLIRHHIKTTPEILWYIASCKNENLIRSSEFLKFITPFLIEDPSIFRYVIGVACDNLKIAPKVLCLIQEIPELLLYCPLSSLLTLVLKTPNAFISLYKEKPEEVLKIAKVRLPTLVKKEFLVLVWANRCLKQNAKPFLHKNPLTVIREHMFAINFIELMKEIHLENLEKLIEKGDTLLEDNDDEN